MKFFKLNLKTKLKYIALIAFYLMFITSCEVGLGSSIDTIPPTSEITSHDNNDAVAKTFIIRGVATDNEEISIINVDFDDADIHFELDFSKSPNWWKKTSVSDQWNELETDDVNYCIIQNKHYYWSLAIDTADKRAGKTDNEFSFTVIAQDRIGNSGKSQKAECNLTIDENDPDASITAIKKSLDDKPEAIKKGSYELINIDLPNYELRSTDKITSLFNGTLIFEGRQNNSNFVNGMKIAFDNGKLEFEKRESTKEIASLNLTGSVEENLDELEDKISLGDETIPTVYYETILKDNLNEWSFTVKPEDWATNESGLTHNLHTGKHLIRVVATSISTTKAWERKVLGYFIWWPEADEPWITIDVGDKEPKASGAYEAYPNSSINGRVQDDDGIRSFVSQLYRENASGSYIKYNSQVNHNFSSVDSIYNEWAVKVPDENGNYKLELTATDIYGKKVTETRYFKTADVSAPKIEFTLPYKDPLQEGEEDNSNRSVIINAAGNITFKGKVWDDGGISSLAMVWLNPAKRTDPNNKIKYITGDAPEWNKATELGFDDDNGNKIYKFPVPDRAKSYDINKTFNIYSDFEIGTIDKNGNLKTLIGQEFVFRVSDGITNTTKIINLSGDSISPELGFKDITIDGVTLPLGSVPAFKKPKKNEATITGTWSDKFTNDLVNSSKLYDIEVTWGNGDTAPVIANKFSNGTWSCKIPTPKTGGTITAKLKDFGGNTKIIQTAVTIEADDVGLARIGCELDDGSYTVGKEIILTLEFTKDTKVKGSPSLSLNNGGTAVYLDGSGSTAHRFKYIVSSGDRDIDKLSVTNIVANGAKWEDSAVNGNDITSFVKIENLPSGTNLSDTRTIKIDKSAPRIKSIKALSSPGSYKAGTSLLFMLEFNEDVNITSLNSINLRFANSITSTNNSLSGSRYVLFTYDIQNGQNASPLSFNSVVHDSAASVTDLAGNELTNWAVLETVNFSNFHIDTSVPAAPSLQDGKNSSVSWSPSKMILDLEGTSFTINGEPGAYIEYSVDNGANWLPYTSKVSLSNNGSYTVKARQTDIAGNVSESYSHATITVDKGELLSRITASTVSGTYSQSTDTKIISGKIEFRKAVTIAKGATVTLNVQKANGQYYSCPIEECKTTNGTAKVFTFKYEIQNGDYLDGDLDVTGWSFSEVSVGGVSGVGLAFPSEGNGKLLKENRSINIVTGIPVIKDLKFTGKGSNAVLELTFDRNITKGSGDIVFTYDTNAAGNEFHIPTVLTDAEYDELKSETAIANNYKAGLNGAHLVSGVLENDSTTKYILDFEKTDTDTTIVNAFINKKKHIVTIPLISDQVEIVNLSGTQYKRVLRVTLGELYELPVMGAIYELKLPSGAVVDAVNNENDEYKTLVTSEGVEIPQIRIKKPNYSINNAGDTKKASANMATAQTAKMKLDCRSPGATISYNKTETESSSNTITEAKTTNVTKTAVPAIPNSFVSTYTSNSEVELGTGKTVDSYDNAKGLKIPIIARASKAGLNSDIAYELATRTVLKFSIVAYDTGGGSYKNLTGIKENGTELIYHDLKVWVQGGDAPYGANSIDPFPLSWGDPSNFKLMQGSFTSADNMLGKWWWVSWDISAPTYHGFSIGDVPSDALTNGPTVWYVGECSWVPVKSTYVLYPGETLIMQTGTAPSTFLFRLKNKGVR